MHFEFVSPYSFLWLPVERPSLEMSTPKKRRAAGVEVASKPIMVYLRTRPTKMATRNETVSIFAANQTQQMFSC